MLSTLCCFEEGCSCSPHLKHMSTTIQGISLRPSIPVEADSREFWLCNLHPLPIRAETRYSGTECTALAFLMVDRHH